jgi:virginiamycin B lyase
MARDRSSRRRTTPSSTGSGPIRLRGRVAALAALSLLLIAACRAERPDGADPGATPGPATETDGGLEIEEFDVPAGSHPHDVAVGEDGRVWYTAQRTGELGVLDPDTGETRQIPLGAGSSPHGVIVGPDDAPWITDTGLNAIVRVDPETDEIERFDPPDDVGGVGMHTAVFDPDGVLWFTGSSGYFGRVDPEQGEVEVFEAPGGGGPYGITSTPESEIYYASLAQSHIAHVEPDGAARVIEPPTRDQGARRVWTDSKGRIWVSEWNAGKLGRYDPSNDGWEEWDLPGDNPMAYSVFVDDTDIVWVSDFGGNAYQRFDPTTEEFTTIELPSEGAEVRQMHGRPGEMWGAESGVDKLVVVRTR